MRRDLGNWIRRRQQGEREIARLIGTRVTAVSLCAIGNELTALARTGLVWTSAAGWLQEGLALPAVGEHH